MGVKRRDICNITPGLGFMSPGLSCSLLLCSYWNLTHIPPFPHLSFSSFIICFLFWFSCKHSPGQIFTRVVDSGGESVARGRGGCSQKWRKQQTEAFLVGSFLLPHLLKNSEASFTKNYPSPREKLKCMFPSVTEGPVLSA